MAGNERLEPTPVSLQATARADATPAAHAAFQNPIVSLGAGASRSRRAPGSHASKQWPPLPIIRLIMASRKPVANP
jgi:hypothetical protein